MGWSHCGNLDGREIGYGVPAMCDEPGCSEIINRGLAYLCGDMHGDGESCNGYFCYEHLGIVLCRRCEEQQDEANAKPAE